ncbi:unnamed protein product, partial [Pylaiella littoralis]
GAHARRRDPETLGVDGRKDIATKTGEGWSFLRVSFLSGLRSMRDPSSSLSDPRIATTVRNESILRVEQPKRNRTKSPDLPSTNSTISCVRSCSVGN